MSLSLYCDNDTCDVTVDADDDDALLWWIKVGWRQTDPYDACSYDCAREILDYLSLRQIEIEALPVEVVQ